MNKYLLPQSLLVMSLIALSAAHGDVSYAIPTRDASDDAAFQSQLGSLRETLQPGFTSLKSPRSNSLREWGPKDPKPSREYSEQEALNDPRSERIIKHDQSLYFIDQGYVFQKNLVSGDVVYLRDIKGVLSIHLYKGALLAVESRKWRTFFRRQEREARSLVAWSGRSWWSLWRDDVAQFVSTDDDLLVATRKGTLLAYKGISGRLVFKEDSHFVTDTTTVPDGNGGTTTIATLRRVDDDKIMNGDRVVRLQNSKLSNVISLRRVFPSTGKPDVEIGLKDGAARSYNELRLTLP